MKVLVVEDEAPILRNICRLIEKCNPAFQVYYRAQNGKNALEVIRTQPVDLIFLDIRMPVMDGLEVMRHMKQEELEIPVIVVSGYKDFEYVQQALRHGSMDYLLKPVKMEELRQILNKAEQYFIKRNCCDTPKRLDGEAETDGKKESVQYEFALCCFGAFYIEQYTQTISVLQERMEERLRGFLHSQLDEEEFWLIPGKNAQEQFVLLRQGNGRLGELLRRFLKSESHTTIVLTIILYRRSLYMHEIYKAQKEMRRGAMLSMSVEESGLFELEECEAIEPDMKMSLLEAVHFPAQMYEAVREEIEKRGKKRYDILRVLKAAFLIYSGKFPCRYNNIYLEESVNSIIESVYSMEALYQEVKKLIVDAFYEESVISGNKEKFAYEVRNYLEGHYSMHVSNQTLSDEFGFVPAYIRTIFQQQFQQSPMEYLQRVRIEKSKTWLKETELSLKEIAEALGFSDQLYFSKVFKKTENMTPTEYRRRTKQSIEER